jgi:Uma2 family endonuclease
MSDFAKQNRRATYDDILKLPKNMVGEIIGGELFVSPRPASKHALAASRLTGKLEPSFGGGGSGPGGWWIISEPEIHIGNKPNEEVYVPDLAGWRRERMPEFPDVPFFEMIPDWVCEILSPSNMRLDRTKKVPQYAVLGVKHLWLINPRDKMLEVFRLEGDKWSLLSTYIEADKVRVEPFEAMEFDLGSLWA